MGIVKKILTFTTLFNIVFSLARAQELDSNYFKLHTVIKGETSYGIAKKYQINLNDFFNANPDATNGLSRGQILKIPIPVFSNYKSGSEKDSIPKKHIVKNGETLWSISKLYGVQFSIIKSYNKLTSNDLSKDQILLIPNILTDTINKITPIFKYVEHPLLNKCDTLIIHNVKKKETLYSISKKYGIGIDKIIENNVFLEDKGLKKGQDLKIIYKIIDCEEDSVKLIPEQLFRDSNAVVDPILNISILLPFFIEESDSIIENCPENIICELNKSSERSILLYNGIMMALEEFKKQGYNLELTLFDTKYDTNIVKDILIDSLMLESDLIIGPIFSKNVKLVRTFSNLYRVPMISLFNIPSQALFNYPDLYKLKVSRSIQSKEIANFLKMNNSKDNILLISDTEDRKSKVYSRIFSEVYNDSIVLEDTVIVQKDSIFPNLVKRGEDWENLHSKLSHEKNNFIVICSNQTPFLTYAFNQIIEFSNSEDHYNSKFTIFGFEDLYRINTVDIIYKNKFNLHFSSVGLIDYESDKVINFIESYQNYFSAEPTQLVFDGYDLVYSIMLEVFSENPKKNIYHGLKTDVDFNKIDLNSGSENTIVKFYNLKNYQLNQLFKN